MLKGIIFDMDGTIALTEPFHHKAFDAVFKKRGVNDFSFEELISKYSGSGSANIFTKVFADRGIEVEPEEIKDCIGEKRELYNKIVQETEIPLVEGVREFLNKINSRGLKRIIATGNSNLEAVRVTLEKCGIAENFPQILSIVDMGRGKPFPDIFTEAAKRLGLAEKECVVLEDAINGVKAAVDASIRCIAFTTTTEKKFLIEAGASAVIENYYQLTDEILYGEK